MTYRVIQWATGGVGRSSISGIATHPELELVGCWVHSESKEGKDAGELIHAFSVAIHMKASVMDLLATPWYHPTLSEMVTYPLEEIAEELGLL